MTLLTQSEALPRRCASSRLNIDFALKIVDQGRDPGPCMEATDIATTYHRIGLTSGGQFRFAAVQLHHMDSGLPDSSFIHDRDVRPHWLSNVLKLCERSFPGRMVRSCSIRLLDQWLAMAGDDSDRYLPISGSRMSRLLTQSGHSWCLYRTNGRVAPRG